MEVLKTISAIIVLSATATVARADLVNPNIPSWRGDAGTSYYQWDSFTESYAAPNYNDSGNGSAVLYNFAFDSFITGVGNIYNQNGGLNIHVYGYGSIEQAVLNIASQGTGFDYSTVLLYVGDGENGAYFSADEFAIENYVAIPNFGAEVTSSFTWGLSNYDGIISEWAFFFNGTEAHNSLDAVSVDIFTSVVPAPSVLVLLGLAGMSTMRRRIDA